MLAIGKVKFWIIGLVAAATIGACAYYARHLTKTTAPLEVGFVTPAGNADRTWTEFLGAIRMAASEKKLKVEENPSDYSCKISTPTADVLVKLYPETGVRGLRRIVRELADRKSQTPIALIGASNSLMTGSLARAMSDKMSNIDGPLLLLTTSTADDLTTIYPQKTFRFGYCNSYQAKSVVQRLKQHYAEIMEDRPSVRVVSVCIEDDPFSVDLARKFEKELSAGLSAEFVDPPTEFQQTGSSKESKSDAQKPIVWSLPTATGNLDEPNDREKRLARAFVERMVHEPGKQWVLVIPTQFEPLRRLTFAIYGAMEEAGFVAEGKDFLRRLVIITGDAVTYSTFTESTGDAMSATVTPCPMIFFSHANPVDPALPKGAKQLPTNIAVNRLMLETIFSTIGSAKKPSNLAENLRQFTSKGDNRPFFDHYERRSGGGAIVVIPRSESQSFQIQLPKQWQN